MSELRKMLKEAKAKNAIQAELIKFVENRFEDFESNWFEETQEDFYSQYAEEHSVSFDFDENLNVSIVGIYDEEDK